MQSGRNRRRWRPYLYVADNGMLVLRNEGCYRRGWVEVFAWQAIEGVLDALLDVAASCLRSLMLGLSQRRRRASTADNLLAQDARLAVPAIDREFSKLRDQII